MAQPIITLTTDFGAADPFVGAMKGVILGINPQATIVDVTHQVPPQDIHAGAFLFDTAGHYFPQGAIPVLVVDPGVGTERRPLLVVGPAASYVGPDNGLLSYVYARALPSASLGEVGSAPQAEPFEAVEVELPPGWWAYHLTSHQYWRHPVSDTFHGRDIFAPVAAHLSNGVAPQEMGVAVDRVAAFTIPRPVEKEGTLVGCVLHVDRFGNLITNIQADALSSADIVIDIAGHRVQGLARSYQEGVPLLAIIGSHGYLEISAKNANASEMLGLGVGDQLRVGLPA